MRFKPKMLIPVAIAGIALVFWWMQRSSDKKQSKRDQEYLQDIQVHLERERFMHMSAYRKISSASSNTVPVLQRDTRPCDSPTTQITCPPGARVSSPSPPSLSPPTPPPTPPPPSRATAVGVARPRRVRPGLHVNIIRAATLSPGVPPASIVRVAPLYSAAAAV